MFFAIAKYRKLQSKNILQQTEEVADTDNTGLNYALCDYVWAELPNTPLPGAAEYADPKNKVEVVRRIEMIVNVEAPILRDTLIIKLLTSFGINKSTISLDATEKALKAASIKNTKLKGTVFY